MDTQEHRARHIAHNEGKNYNKLNKAERNKCLCKAGVEDEAVAGRNALLPAGVIVPDTLSPPEVVVDVNSNSGTGKPDSDTGSPDTSEPKQPTKPKAKRKARKRAKKVL